GWTVASAVAHMGFWDRWQSARWQEMLAGTWSVDEASVLVAEDLANESLHPYWSVIDGAAILALALEAASSVDALIARAPDSLVDSLEGGPNAFLLHRHRHRGDHLEQIRTGLAHAETRAPAAPVDRSYLQRNEASLTRLAELAARLTPAGLTLRVGDGAWTVGQVLGHMAFWDRFLAAPWRAALASGTGEQPTVLPDELAGLLNDALPPTWGAFAAAGHGAIEDTVAAARAVDGIIAGLPATTPVEAILAERPALLDRSIHRLEHLSAIDLALAKR
ncbi:MAG: DinB family protein, partial [Candidatus Limnocylindrales bacterium]